jgi:hypothetical protein
MAELSKMPGTWCALRGAKCTSEGCEYDVLCAKLFAAGRFLMSNQHSEITLKRYGGSVLLERTSKEQVSL